MDYLAGRFSGARTLVEDVESAFKEFYENVGQHLRAWTAPPPKYRNQNDEQKQEEDDDSDAQLKEVKHEPTQVASSPAEAPQTAPVSSETGVDSNAAQIASIESQVASAGADFTRGYTP